MDIKITYEDKNLIVVIKPPGIPSQRDKTGDKSLVCLIKEYLISEKNISEPYVGVVHRLDRPVGGIMVFSKNENSTKYLSKAFSEYKVVKTYQAVLCGNISNSEGELVDYLVKNGRLNISRVADKNEKNAKISVLNYKIIGRYNDTDFGDLSLAEINLKTGRHHQIRVQFSNVGWPLWGDNKYNEMFKNQKGWTQIALFSTYLEFNHPITDEKLKFSDYPVGYPFSLFSNVVG